MLSQLYKNKEEENKNPPLKRPLQDQLAARMRPPYVPDGGLQREAPKRSNIENKAKTPVWKTVHRVCPYAHMPIPCTAMPCLFPEAIIQRHHSFRALRIRRFSSLPSPGAFPSAELTSSLRFPGHCPDLVLVREHGRAAAHGTTLVLEY